MALELSGDWSGLLAWCRRWIKAEAKRADAWFALGTAYSRLGRTPAAIDAYRHTLRLDPQHVDAWFNLGLTYGRVGRHRDAIAALRHTLKIDPADVEAWSQLGWPTWPPATGKPPGPWPTNWSDSTRIEPPGCANRPV